MVSTLEFLGYLQKKQTIFFPFWAIKKLQQTNKKFNSKKEEYF